MFQKIILILLSIGMITQVSWAQEDSVSIRLLESVEISEEMISHFSSGVKVQKLDSLSKLNNQGYSLAQLLSQFSGLYFKEYGGGMLASISFRGTSSNHTAVLWNGVNINSFTAGGADFNLLPVSAFDQISIQYGGGSALYGTDAIGGSIQLNSEEPIWEKQFAVQVNQSVGSFGMYSSNGSIKFENEKWSVRSRLYRFSAINNFSFQNTSKIGFPTERQQNAAVLNYGAVQEIYYRLNQYQSLSFKAWYHFSDREIQATMSSLGSQDRQEDWSQRYVLDYQNNNTWGRLDAKLAFTQDYLLFNNFEPIDVKRGIASIEFEKAILPNIFLRTGGNYQLIVADVENYVNQVQENRSNWFASLRWEISPIWNMSVNTRQAFVSGFSSPFAPSLGSELQLFEKNKSRLFWTFLLSRSFRIPTLNDRYWNDGQNFGNPDLQSEFGWNGESSLKYQLKGNQNQLEFAITYFQNQVENWIQWQPVGIGWSPVNLFTVNVKGIEAETNYQWQTQDFSGKIGIGAVYSQSINQDARFEGDRSEGKQLIYAPHFRGNTFAQIFWRNWSLLADANYTSFRYITSDNEDFLGGYGLVNLSLGKKISLGKSSISASFQVRNLLNESYQNFEDRAMPGRNFQLNFLYHFLK